MRAKTLKISNRFFAGFSQIRNCELDLSVKLFFPARRFKKYAPDVIGHGSRHGADAFVPVATRKLDFGIMLAKLFNRGEDDIVPDFVVVRMRTPASAGAIAFEPFGYLGRLAFQMFQLCNQARCRGWLHVSILLPMMEMGLFVLGNRSFEFFDRIEHIGLKPLQTLGQGGFERGDPETVRRRLDATADLQTVLPQGGPEDGEAVVVQDAQDAANILSALFTEDFAAVRSRIFSDHRSSASRFSSR